MIVATAGHIDHGKTALVKALTGVDADRLPEEKRRGITVDLGFAYGVVREGGPVLSFVDVPGHEKLVRTMLAGATGVDFVLLVVAADDGVMPQTREHLAILDLLGLSRGVAVVTKADKVDATRLHAVAAEVAMALEGTSLAGSPVLPVSAHRGDGLDELRGLLDRAGAAPSAATGDRGFRLAVDRAFTLPGAGLVVTGTVHAGRVAPGDRLLLAGAGSRAEVRVRGLHAANAEAASGAAGQRCALNISGARVDKAAISRGDWIVAPQLPEPTLLVDALLRLLPGEAQPLRHWTPVHVHCGAADITGRVALLEGGSLAPGDSALVRLILDQPTAVLGGDRFVLRDQSARRTIGGGRIVDPLPPRRGIRKPERLAFLHAFAEPDHGDAMAALVEAAPLGFDAAHFASARNLDPTERDALLPLVDAVAVGPLILARTRWEVLRADVLAAIDGYAEANPGSFGATATELLRREPLPRRAPLRIAIEALVAEGAVVRLGQLHQRPGFTVELTLEEENLWSEIERLQGSASLDPLRFAVLAETLQVSEEALRPFMEKLGRMGRLRRVSKAYFLLPRIVTRLAEAAAAAATVGPTQGSKLGKTGEGPLMLTVGRFREATGISRHATMPVLEFFDRVGFTARHGDGRRIRAAAEAVFGQG